MEFQHQQFMHNGIHAQSTSTKCTPVVLPIAYDWQLQYTCSPNSSKLSIVFKNARMAYSCMLKLFNDHVHYRGSFKKVC